MRKKIRVMIVDDAPLIRELLIDALSTQEDMEVVATASDGEQALELLRRHEPDVITLDIDMPKMNGLETLDRILTIRPTPVIMVSSHTQRTAEVTLQALDRGAMDYVAKPEGLEEAGRVFCEEVPNRIRNMAGADVERVLRYRKARQLRQKVAERTRQITATAPNPKLANSCIAIGVSTGGPPALSALFSALEAPLPPIVVVQHMPQLFTGPFAKRLNSISSLEVREAVTGDELKPNLALIAPGGKHLRLKRDKGAVRVEIFDGDFVSGHKPSVDVLMKTAAEIYGRQCVGVIMTGMGRDGADGCKAIRQAGGYVLGQDEGSSDVYGMNKVAFQEGGVDEQVAIGELPKRIMTLARRGGSSTSATSPPAHVESPQSQLEQAIASRVSVAAQKEYQHENVVVPAAIAKFNLCVVEDDPAQLQLLMHRLKHVRTDRLSLFGTSSPQEAMARIEARSVDILIADLMMPQYSGVDLLRELKRRNLCTQMLIMTATADVESLLSAFELGANDYLLKPIDPQQIEKVVVESLERLTRWRNALAGTFRKARKGGTPSLQHS